MSEVRIRPAVSGDIPRVEALAVAAEMFPADEVGFIGDQFEAGARGEVDGAHWVVLVDSDGVVEGAAYYAREPFADRMWNLYFLVVDPAASGRGLGTALVRHVEEALRQMGEAEARTLVVETSSTDAYARTRAFYERLGFAREATIRQFYGPTDDKVVFWKSLVDPGRST